MLKASDQERQEILDYFASQAHGEEEVELAQKVYSERVYSTTHDVWDVHTDQARWWIITNPTNIYRQDQFPNMDLALTFHVGLCIRIPRSEKPRLAELQVEPLVAAWRGLDEARAALDSSQEVEDFQAVGVRCRESLVSLIHVAQELVTLPPDTPRPKRSDVRAWSDVIADSLLAGDSHKERRSLLKTAAGMAWSFTNWLTHAREASAHDAEAAIGATELTLSVCTSALIRRIRGVPERCPSCGSQRLSPERSVDPDHPEHLYERPACQRCAWKGTPVRVTPPPPPADTGPPPSPDECSILDPPLRSIGERSRRPKR
jgi:hypothetical protein